MKLKKKNLGQEKKYDEHKLKSAYSGPSLRGINTLDLYYYNFHI